MPPSLPGGRGRRGLPPLAIFAGALALLVMVSVGLVIGVGSFIHAEQQYEDMQWRAAYYGRPTQPFSSTLMSNVNPQTVGTLALLTTPLPGIANPVLSVSSSDAALTEPDSASTDGETIAGFCDQFGTPTSITLFDWNDWSTVSVSNPLVAQLPMSWDASPSFWQGYNSAKPFNIPDDSRDRWRLRLFNADGSEHWIQIGQSASTPGTLYAYAFQIITPYTDKQGNHFGYHPCRAFTIPAVQMNILLSSLGAYQNSGSRFPDFVPSSDSRWIRGSATPINGTFVLRSIPTLVNNDPLKNISEATACFFITDVNWGAWAQIKLGDITAWVDTSSVRLEAAS